MKKLIKKHLFYILPMALLILSSCSEDEVEASNNVDDLDNIENELGTGTITVDGTDYNLVSVTGGPGFGEVIFLVGGTDGTSLPAAAFTMAFEGNLEVGTFTLDGDTDIIGIAVSEGFNDVKSYSNASTSENFDNAVYNGTIRILEVNSNSFKMTFSATFVEFDESNNVLREGVTITGSLNVASGN